MGSFRKNLTTLGKAIGRSQIDKWTNYVASEAVEA